MKNYLRWQTALLICLFHAGIYAETIDVGAPLPALNIDDKGELIINGEDVDFKPWSTDELANKVVYLQYMAARPSADKMNRHVNDAVEGAGFPKGSLMSAVVVNLDDVTFGASGWALKQLKKNKKKHPYAHLIADSEGKGLKTWQLKSGGSAIGIISKTGKVLFFKEGALNQDEVTRLISLIRDQVSP